MKRRGRLAAPSFFNTDDFRPSTSNAGSASGSFLHLDPTAASVIRGGDVPTAFGNDYLSFSSSASTSGSHFNYSQKNFHTSDGNLYSVFSPLQGQRSRSKPSFLRQHLQQQHQHHHQQQQQQQQQHQQQTTSTVTSNCSRSDSEQQQQQRTRFQLREEVSSDQTPASKFWTDREEKERDGDFRWFDRHVRSNADDIFNKEKQKFYKNLHPEPKSATSTSSFHSSRWPEEERLDISSLLKTKFGSNTTSGTTGLFQREDSWSDDDEDDDGPLNLCMADRRRRRKSSSSSSKSDLEEHHHHLRRRRRHQATEDFNENRFSAYSSFFKRDFLINDDHSKHFRVRRRNREEQEEVEQQVKAEDSFFNSTRVAKDDATVVEEPKVLDLSMRNVKTNSNRATAPDVEQTSKWSTSPSTVMDTGEWLKTAPPTIRKQFPRISEMLENMHLRDDEWRQAMQIDSYRAALETTRDRLIHTHPDMFIGWPPPEAEVGTKMDVVMQSKPTDSQQQQQQNFYKQQQPLIDVQQRKTATPTRLQTPSGGKSEKDQCSISRPSSTLLVTPLRSCSAVSIGAEMGSTVGGVAQQRPLAGSSSCPEVPSLADIQSRGVKARWTVQKGERPKGRPPRKLSVETSTGPSSSSATSSSVTGSSVTSPFANDISICKFKLVKGLHPVLEEKKTLHVPLPVRSSPSSSPQRQSTPVVTMDNASSNSNNNTNDSSTSYAFNRSPSQPEMSTVRHTDSLRTFKFHVDGGGGGSGETFLGAGGGSGARKATSGPGSPAGGVTGAHNRRVRKRSRKTLAREQLEATFREQGFLIKTQQVSSAEGAVYCKFRQLKKFTRYLFKSWKDHLPLEIQGGVECMTSPTSGTPTKPNPTNDNTSTI